MTEYIEEIKHYIEEWNLVKNYYCFSDKECFYTHESILILKEKILHDVNNSQNLGRLDDEEIKKILDRRFGL